MKILPKGTTPNTTSHPFSKPVIEAVQYSKFTTDALQFRQLLHHSRYACSLEKSFRGVIHLLRKGWGIIKAHFVCFRNNYHVLNSFTCFVCINNLYVDEIWCIHCQTLLVHQAYRPPLDLVLNRLHPVHTLTGRFSRIHFNIVLPSASRFPKGNWVTISFF